MPNSPPIRLGWPRGLAGLPIPLIALALALTGQVALGSRTLPWFGAALLCSGGLLIGVAALRDSRDARTAESTTLDAAAPRSCDSLVGGRLGLIALALVTLVAAAFRLPWLGRLPPGLAADEARIGLDAVAVLATGWNPQAWHGWPIFHLATIGSVATLGSTALAVRLPSAVAGIAYAAALFMLGRQLGGNRLGTATGLLGAVMFWHADMSRGAWSYGAWGLTCEAIGVALLLRTTRRPSPALTALAGVAFGLALQVSWAALVALAAGGVMALSALGADGPSPRRWGATMAPFLVYFAVAAGPVFVGLSVPDRPANPDLTSTIEGSSVASFVDAAIRLLLMFNVSGDPSPLHALRGEPMLDPVTASLFVLGIGAAIVRWHDARTGAVVAWLLGALSVAAVVGTGAQPDSLAAIHALTPALLLAGSALTTTAGALGARRLAHTALPLDLALILTVVIVGINGHTLFVRRPADAATWSAYASAEALAAREIRELASTHVIHLADVWLDHPTIRYLVPGLTTPRGLDPAATLPFQRDESFAYFAPGHLDVVPEDLERLYEDGEIDRYRSPLDESVVAVRSFRAPARVVADARGVTLRETQIERSRTNRFTLQTFRVDWPVAGQPARPATLDLFAAVSVDLAGTYRLRLDAPPGASLNVNGVFVARPGEEVSVPLARGSQRFNVLAPVDEPARIELRWAPPGGAGLQPIPADHLFREQRAAIGLLALYRSGHDPAAPVELPQVERYLQRQESAPPLARPYVVDWVGMLDAPKSGTYRFRLDSSGPASLWLNDQPILLGVQPNTGPVSVVLPDGDHRIQVRFVDVEGPTRFDLFWAPPGEEFSAIPTSRFDPPDASVDAVHPLPASLDTMLAPLSPPRVRWLASTEGEPRGVATRSDGAVFLTNMTSRQVQQVLGEGRTVVGLPAPLSAPTDVEIGPDGRVWTIDALYGEIVRLGGDGAVDLLIANTELGLSRPRGFAIAQDGTILIADTGGSRVVRLAADGTLLAQIGPDVGGPERIRQPTDVAVGPDGDLFVVNGETGAVMRLTAEGRYIRHWTVLPSDTERGARLAIGPDRSIWVSEPEGRRVSRFTLDGAPAGVVDQTRAGRLLRVPVGIAVGADGTLYVADASLRAVIALSFAP